MCIFQKNCLFCALLTTGKHCSELFVKLYISWGFFITKFPLESCVIPVQGAPSPSQYGSVSGSSLSAFHCISLFLGLCYTCNNKLHLLVMLFKDLSLDSFSVFYWVFSASALLSLLVQTSPASAFGLSEMPQPTLELLRSSQQQLGNEERGVQRQLSG